MPQNPYATPPFVPQDPNIFQNLRFGNVFGGGAEGGPTAAPPTSQVEPMGPQEPTANNRLLELLGNYPETQAPGVMRKIVLSMIGLNNPELAYELMNQPSGEQQDWLSQIELAQAAAELEDQVAGRDIQRAGQDIQIAGQGIREEELAFDREKFERELTPEEKHLLDRELIDLRGSNVAEQIKQRAEAARETNRLRLANQLDTIAARAEDASQIEVQRQTGRATLETQRQAGRATLEAQRQAGRIDRAEKGESESDRARRIDNNVREHLLRHPEDDMYLDRDREGNVKGVKPVGSDAKKGWGKQIVTQE